MVKYELPQEIKIKQFFLKKNEANYDKLSTYLKLCKLLELTKFEESSGIEIALLLLLSSLSKTKERTMLDPCFWDDGRELFDPRPTKDDCNVFPKESYCQWHSQDKTVAKLTMIWSNL